jgi:hypothetical protein
MGELNINSVNALYSIRPYLIKLSISKIMYTYTWYVFTYISLIFRIYE